MHKSVSKVLEGIRRLPLSKQEKTDLRSVIINGAADTGLITSSDAESGNRSKRR